MQQESIQAALALLLGPKTEYRTRLRASRRLAKQGSTILPLILSTFSNYPEITRPAWPWWPPQYEHTSRLLLHLCQLEKISLAELLQHPILGDAPGPVLWTSIMEAASLVPQEDNEELLCQGLHTGWASVRYAAAMALATRARTHSLHPSTCTILHHHQGEQETYPVRLTASYALLNNGDPAGLEILMCLLLAEIPAEIRKAATFILATEVPLQLTTDQQERLSAHLIQLLGDPDIDIAQQAAHALSKIASAQTVTVLYPLLETTDERLQIIILTVLEEIAQHNKTLRHQMRQHTLTMRLLPMLKSIHPDLRRQACYTLAACGGEYVAAVLGTIVMNKEHPGQGEVIECLRCFHGALRAPLRGHIVRWLLRVLATPQEEIQVTALDSLAQLLWQARNSGRQPAWQEISQEIIQDGTIIELLHANSPLLRQRALELCAALGNFLHTTKDLHPYCQFLLLNDSDSGVRACAAYVYGQIGARWAISSLLQALLDADEHVASTALHALGEIATTEDTIVVYALLELARLQEEPSSAHNLAREAQAILKKWQKAEQNEARKTLHSLN
ncbi:HEAT repeat domain-containing protein [Dictyobacter kobayashii]|uniref:HEAT repeat-containing PBS lyase n=1 Tax=Dictyobacter kobayashii TaxID=2014872 RepID=A0A402ACV3_9CHLR|nr:HEAT repeat domain-containing protein [Dictyobacter kobayashii]GCE16939.1 hypothetical protein KDK_07390 [Dictyobacter kobayashii]